MPDHVWLFTYKDGLLARLAHDLRLHVERFSVMRIDEERVLAKFDPNAIYVDGVMVGERCDRDALDVDDRVKIVETIRHEILRGDRHPSILFKGRLREREDGALNVSGDLSLAGVTRPLAFLVTRRGKRLRATVALRPSEFGIPPFKALAGAIRLQDRVVVELDLDAALIELPKPSTE